MHLNQRPMSEAPLNEPILIRYLKGLSGWTATSYRSRGFENDPELKGFYLISDLLRAAEIVAAITPEGCVYVKHGCSGPLPSGRLSREVFFEKLPPPVRYDFVAEEKPRIAVKGDWIWIANEWQIVDDPERLLATHLCARRVEVKP